MNIETQKIVNLIIRTLLRMSNHHNGVRAVILGYGSDVFPLRPILIHNPANITVPAIRHVHFSNLKNASE